MYKRQGVESGSQVVVDKIVNKHLDLKYVQEVVSYIRSLDMSVHRTFTYGLPGETKEDMIRTKKFIKDTNCSTVQESGTAEIEGAIGSYDDVAEAAVVGYPHDIKGEGVYAFITLMTGVKESTDTMIGIKNKVREIIGPHATPDKIQFSPALPKTRSGKIMR